MPQVNAAENVIIHERTIYLDTARTDKEFNFAGWYLRVINVSNVNVSITSKVDNEQSEPYTLSKAAGWKHRYFNKLLLSWEAQPGASITIAYGGNPQTYDPTQFEVYVPASSTDVNVANDVDNALPVDVQGTITVIAENPTRDMSEEDAATWATIDEETNGTSAQQIYQVPTGRRFDLVSGNLTGNSAQLKVVDGSGGVRWLEAANTLGMQVVPKSIPAGYKILLNTMAAANTAKATLSGKVVNLDGSLGLTRLTSDPTQVGTGGATNCPIFLAAADMPAAMLATIRVDGGDVTAWSGSTQLACVPMAIAGVCVGWYVLVPSFSDSVATVIDLRYNGIDKVAAVDSTYGRDAVFANSRIMLPMIYDPSGSSPQFTDWTGRGNNGVASGSMTSDDLVAGGLHKAVDFDGNDDIVSVTSADVENQTNLTLFIRFNCHTTNNSTKSRIIICDANDEFSVYATGQVYAN
ncbi:MAG TPA: hypothetical protein DER01_00675 [Phycisphaerales bacterium]|nr:hypothetical protein [Phycisphaerales bacterium]|tara:strand:+ start:2914 stop:4308 length:1395 start_codon:yes stop_codon:yes gene_type:complete